MPLKVSDGMGAWIDDFKKSDAPQFKGKSEKERRDQAIAAYLAAKRGAKSESVEEATSPTDLARAMAAFKKRGGKITKAPAAKAQGYHGRDDPGKDMHGILDRPDTKKSFMGTRKKAKSMARENYQVQKYVDGKKDGPAKSFGGNLKKATTHASKMKQSGAGDHRVHKENNVDEQGAGLWANIRAKRARGERMRKPGEKGAPTQAALDRAKGK